MSESSPRHRFIRKSALKKSAVSHSDFDEPESSHFQDHDGQRSSSVCAGAGAGADIPPRMAQLETLEAKMASIEVSLSMTPRRRKSSSLSGRCALPLQPPAPPVPGPHAAEPLRNLKNKENILQSLKEQLCMRGPAAQQPPGQPPLSEAERRTAEERAAALRADMEAKRGAIKALKAALERLDITDNIDIRIQQAELEYQLGREELELLTLLEQSRALQLLLEQDDSAKTKRDQQTIYSCIEGTMLVTLHAVQVEYDPKSPQFGAGARARLPGLWLDWALDHTGMCKGDRLLEVNGKLVLSKSKEDMTRLLSISPSPAQLVVLRTRPLEGVDTNGNRAYAHTALAQVGSLRAELNALREQAEEARRTKDGLRSDNLRLTHRITYLEEQVAELLSRNREQDPEVEIVTPPKVITSTVNTQKNVTNINITSEPSPKSSQPKSDVQVFQKGPDVTAIVANIPGLEIGGKDTAEASANLPIIRPRSNQSNVSSTQIAIGHSPKSSGSKSSYSVELNDSPKHAHSHFNSNHVHFNHKTGKISNSRYSLQPSKSSNSLDHGTLEGDKDSNYDTRPYSIRQSLSHHSIHKSKDYKNYDYNSETSAAIEIIKKNQKQYFDKGYKNSKIQGYSKALSDDNSDILKCYKRDHKKSTSILEYFERGINGNRKPTKKDIEITKQNNDINGTESNIIENCNHKSSVFGKRLSKLSHTDDIHFHPDRDYIDHRIDGKIILNAHKSSRRMSKLHVKKTADCDSEPTQNIEDAHSEYRRSRMKILDYTSEPNSIQGHYKKHYQNSDRPRPTPPKKPLRLSLHRAQSMQSVEITNNKSDTFYLHDPIQRQSSANDVASKDECKFSISNSNNNINGLFHGNEEYRIKPESSYARPEGNQLSVKFSLNDDHKTDSQDNISEKKVKKRPHNGKISHSSSDRLSLLNGHDTDRNNGQINSRSESLSSIPKNPNSPLRSSDSKDSLLNGNMSDSSRLTSKEKARAEHQIKSKRGFINDLAKMNGYSNYDKNESASESSRTHSRAESCHSGFRWPSSNVFKNIRIDSPTRSNGHISDSSRK